MNTEKKLVRSIAKRAAEDFAARGLPKSQRHGFMRGWWMVVSRMHPHLSEHERSFFDYAEVEK